MLMTHGGTSSDFSVATKTQSINILMKPWELITQESLGPHHKRVIYDKCLRSFHFTNPRYGDYGRPFKKRL